MTVRGYTLSVDWDHDRDYDDPYEDVTSDLLAEPVLTLTWGRDSAQAPAEMTSGKLTFGLRNDTRKYSPENGSSPLAGWILPGRAVRLTIADPGLSASSGVETDFESDIY